MRNHKWIGIILYTAGVLAVLVFIWFVGYRVGVESGELKQFTSDSDYVESLYAEIDELNNKVHTCPYCNKLFLD